MFRVFVTRSIDKQALARLRAGAEVEVWEHADPPLTAAIVDKGRGCAGLLTLLTDQIDAQLLDALGPDLRIVSNLASGTDNIDLAACSARGVVVGHTPRVLDNAVADLTLTLLLALARRLPQAIDHVKLGRWRTWEPLQLLGSDVDGATLGVVGFGRIGQAVARRATAFGMRIIYVGGRTSRPDELDFQATRCTLNQLLAESDYVTVHAPLTPQTHHLLDAEAFARMKTSAILINTARGSIVDLEALSVALSRGQIAGAALDVTEPEPIGVGHPILTLPNCIVVPHIGSATRNVRSAMARLAVDNIRAVLDGNEAIYSANSDVYELIGSPGSVRA